jgi:glycerol-3-phosphate acyltransferase PlsY
MLYWIPCLIGAFLVGSIPFGFLIGRAKGVDIRQAGSGNIGATNVGRLLGRKLGIVCFVLDALKGAVPIVVSGVVNDFWGRPLAPDGSGATVLGLGETWPWLLVILAALLGHMYSPWLGFRGGKGVATGFGAMVAMWPLLTVPALIALATWVGVVLATRYVSLASMIAVCTMPITAAALAVLPVWRGLEGPGIGERVRLGAPVILTTAALALFVIYKHRANIGRLRAGTESKLGERRRG